MPSLPLDTLAHTLSPAVTHRSLQPLDTRLDWFAPGLRRAIRRTAPDIVLCMGRMANCYGGGVRSTRQVASRREYAPSAVIATMRTGKPLPLLARRALARVAHIVANSEAARATLQTHYAIPPERISVIPNALVFPPLPTDEATTARTALRREHAATTQTTVLLDCAMFRPEKNQRELIEIATHLPADFLWQLWLAGDGPALAECRALAAKLGVADRVRFLGFVADPRPLYAAADLAVHASKSESLCNFLLEAQAAGLPAVAARAQGIEECLTCPGKTGLVVEHGDRDAFRRAILHFARAEFRLSPQMQTADPATAYLHLFQKLLANP